MFEGIEALSALERVGTVSEAATSLRLTQSAVSKRLKALGDELGYPVVEPDGRRVRLTAKGIAFLERARPLLAELRSLTLVSALEPAFFSLALSDSIAASWGPAVVRRTLKTLPGLELGLHAHRSVLLVESVRLGRYHLGLSTDMPGFRDLVRLPVVSEPMVLVHAGLGTRPERRASLITIERNSATWRFVEPSLRREQPRLLERHLVGVESFGAAIQMARAGFGDALVPEGLPREMGIGAASLSGLKGVKRDVFLLTRKTLCQMEVLKRLHEGLAAEAARYFREEKGS